MDELFTEFSKRYNLFRRFKIDESQISELDISLTKIYLIFMSVVPFYIIIYKIEHYNEDKHYCDTHRNVHSCRNVTFPSCIIEIIINIFGFKFLMESILSKITNTYRFFYKNSIRVIDYIEDEMDEAFDSENKPDNVTKIEIFTEDKNDLKIN